ncbi:hypothetical protein ACOMHN_049874 [Nucella lapillus]
MNNLSSANSGLQDNTTSWTNVSPLAEHPDSQTAAAIWKIYPPFVLLVGGFGNIATIFVMRRIKDHYSSQYAILMSLAVSDLIFLYSDATNWWLMHAFHVDLRLLNSATCKLLFWMQYVSGHTSSWLVTCVTVQRTMAVLWPHRMRVMCTVRRTWIVIAILVFTASALDSHMLVGMDISEENSAINFFLYCLTGTKFRREFMSWIRCGAQSPSAPSVHETASEASRGGRNKHHGHSPLSK